MRRFFKSKPLLNTPVLNPTSPTELVGNLASQGNSKALVVMSSAITLSISPAFGDGRGMPNDSAAGQRGDMGWQMAYASVRMVVEITKESSDLCPPLKVVVGAILTLMKNYDDCHNPNTVLDSQMESEGSVHLLSHLQPLSPFSVPLPASVPTSCPVTLPSP